MTPVELQTALAQEGCYQGHIDGIVGQQTIGAVKQFQAEQGLAQTGLVDQMTIEALGHTLHTVPDVPVNVFRAPDMIAAWESVGDGNPSTAVLEAYFDSALVATLGFGHAILDENGQQIRAAIRGDPAAKARADAAVTRLYRRPWVTLAEARSLLVIDINERVGRMAPLLRDMPTTQNQFDAMVCFTFNVGVRAFATSTVLARHKARVPVSGSVAIQPLLASAKIGQMGPTMEGAFTAWCHAGGEFALGLFRRHLCEALVYRGDAFGPSIATARSVT